MPTKPSPIDFNSRPILVFWESTKSCLLACKHCRAEAIRDPLPGELATSQACRFICQLTGFGKPFPVLVITGGDALMRKDLPEVVSLARHLKIPVALSPTVTPLLTATAIDQIKEWGIKMVSISLDGSTAKLHDDLRGVQGHFFETLEAISLFRKKRILVQINTTVMQENVEDLADVASIVKSLDCSVWEIFFLVQVGRGKTLHEVTPLEGEAVCHFLYDASGYGFVVRTVESPFFRRVAAWRANPAACSAENNGFRGIPLYPHLRSRLNALLGPPTAQSKAQTKGTRDGKGIIFVAHNGDVYPSGFLPLSLGNVKSANLVDIYRQSNLLKKIREACFSGRCGTCEFRDSCGGSRARAYAHSGDPLGEDPACAYLTSSTACSSP